jgi:hypothetical protein
LLSLGWGFFWRPAWGILIVLAIVDWGERAWEQLLNAIRGRRTNSNAALTPPQPPSQDLSELEKEFERQQECECQVEATHQASQYKHIPGLPWGDPGSYIKASSADELEQALEALHKREAEKRERVARAALEQARKEVEDEKREQEAREFLIRESERVRKEREDREVRHEAREREREPEPIESAPLIIFRPPSKEAESEVCKCGYPGCLGHEYIDDQVHFPGFTSEAAMAQSAHEIVLFNVEVTRVAGNPSDGTLPASAVRTHRRPRR